MTLPYMMRLVCLCLEVLFLVNLVVSLVVVAVSHLAAHSFTAMRPSRAAQLLFTLRLLPFVLSLSVVLLVCIPDYLRLEENSSVERIGWLCVALATLELASCLISFWRTARALAQSHLFELSFSSSPHKLSAAAPELLLCVTEDQGLRGPLFALVGILRPRLIVSRRLFDTLSTEQFDAALAHECAHRQSHDNFKRLLLMLTPNALPFVNLLGKIERRWEQYAELAADDYATHGQVSRSMALAEALIQVARLGNRPENIDGSLLLASSLSSPNLELAMRVERLMSRSRNPAEDIEGRSSRDLFFIAAAIASSLALFMTVPSLYPFLESLLH
jgi:hypothetical protein